MEDKFTNKSIWGVECWQCKFKAEFKGNHLPLGVACVHCLALLDIDWNERTQSGVSSFIDTPVDSEGKGVISFKADCPGCQGRIHVAASKLTAHCASCDQDFYRNVRSPNGGILVVDIPTYSNRFKEETIKKDLGVSEEVGNKRAAKLSIAIIRALRLSLAALRSDKDCSELKENFITRRGPLGNTYLEFKITGRVKL